MRRGSITPGGTQNVETSRKKPSKIDKSWQTVEGLTAGRRAQLAKGNSKRGEARLIQDCDAGEMGKLDPEKCGREFFLKDLMEFHLLKIGFSTGGNLRMQRRSSKKRVVARGAGMTRRA